LESDSRGNLICVECGTNIPSFNYQLWDKYFHSICVAVSSKSPCLSRKIGAILVRDRSIISTGFNGPSRGIPHCGEDRIMKDDLLIKTLVKPANPTYPSRMLSECPRRILGYESGTHMELCPAQHAEENAVSNAARLGVSVLGSTLYMNSVIPCKNCFGTLINAGIVEIVVEEITVYDKHTQFLIDNSNIKIRSFDL
jgi:dCMP deaminase